MHQVENRKRAAAMGRDAAAACGVRAAGTLSHAVRVACEPTGPLRAWRAGPLHVRGVLAGCVRGLRAGCVRGVLAGCVRGVLSRCVRGVRAGCVRGVPRRRAETTRAQGGLCRSR